MSTISILLCMIAMAGIVGISFEYVGYLRGTIAKIYKVQERLYKQEAVLLYGIAAYKNSIRDQLIHKQLQLPVPEWIQGNTYIEYIPNCLDNSCTIKAYIATGETYDTAYCVVQHDQDNQQSLSVIDWVST